MLTRLIIAGALFLFACSSGSEAPRDDPSTTYSSNGVAFEYPSSWVSEGSSKPEGAAWTWWFGPVQGWGYVQVIAYEAGMEPTAEQMRQFAEAFFRFVRNDAAGDEPKGGIIETTVAGSDALEASFVRSEGPGGKPAELRALVFAHGSTAYGLHCFYSSEDADVIAGCERVISSFTFDE